MSATREGPCSGRGAKEAARLSVIMQDGQIIDSEAAFLLLPLRLRHKWRLFGIERWLKVKRLPDEVAPKDHLRSG